MTMTIPEIKAQTMCHDPTSRHSNEADSHAVRDVSDPAPNHSDPLPAGPSQDPTFGPEAQAVLYERYCERLLNVARQNVPANLRGRIAASDIVMSAFRRVFKGPAKGRFHFDHDEDFWKLLVTVALNKIRDELRRPHNSTRSSEALAEVAQRVDAEPTPDEHAAFLDSLNRVKSVLNPAEVTFLDLRLQGLKQIEIAAQMGISDRQARRHQRHIEIKAHGLLHARRQRGCARLKRRPRLSRASQLRRLRPNFQPPINIASKRKLLMSANSTRWFAIVLLLMATPPLVSAQQPPSKAIDGLRNIETDWHADRDRMHIDAEHLEADGKLAKAAETVTNILELERTWLTAESPEIVATIEWLAGLNERLELDSAESQRKEALQWRTTHQGKEHWETQDAQRALLNLSMLKSLTAAQRRLLSEANDLADNVQKLSQNGHFASAITTAVSVLEIRKNVLGDKHPDYATSLEDLGWLYENTGNYSRAESLYKQSSDIRRQVLGKQHPDYSVALNNLGMLYDNMGQHADAEKLYKQALIVAKRVHGKRYSEYATILNNLGMLYKEKGDYLHRAFVQKGIGNLAAECGGSGSPIRLKSQ